MQGAVVVEMQPRDVVHVSGRPAGVHDVDQVLVDRDADRQDPAGGFGVGESEPVCLDPEDGDLVAAGVDGEEPASVVAEDDAALVAQAAAGAEATSRRPPPRCPPDRWSSCTPRPRRRRRPWKPRWPATTATTRPR